MAAVRGLCGAAVGLSVCVAAGEGWAEPAVSERGRRPAAEGRPAIGLMADAGVPDGANASLALRPVRWLRIHGGGGTNTVSAGFRGGLSLIPLGAGPSLSFEVGHYRDGDANALVRRFVGSERWLTPLFERLGYTYGNLQAGLDLGRGPVAFFVHVGVSFLRATIHNANQAVEARNGAADDGARLSLTAEPVVRAVIPSAKLGLVVYLE